MSLQVESSSIVKVLRGRLQEAEKSSSGGKHSSTDSVLGVLEDFSRQIDCQEGVSIVARSSAVAGDQHGSHDSTDELKYAAHRPTTHLDEGQVLEDKARQLYGRPLCQARSQFEVCPTDNYGWSGGTIVDTSQSPSPEARNLSLTSGYAGWQREGYRASLSLDANAFSEEQAKMTWSTLITVSASPLSPRLEATTATSSSIMTGLPEATRRGVTEYPDSRLVYWGVNQVLGSKSEDTESPDELTETKDIRDEESVDRSSVHPFENQTTAAVVRSLVESLEESLPRSIQMIGTPSTVSTAPSTDEASLGTDYKLDDPSLVPQSLLDHSMHERAPSWGEDGVLPGLTLPAALPVSSDTNFNTWLPSSPSPSGFVAHHGGGSIRTVRQRVASFRRADSESSENTVAVDSPLSRFGLPFINRSDRSWPQHHYDQSQQRNFLAVDPQLAFLHQRGLTKDIRGLQGLAGPSNLGLYQHLTKKNSISQHQLSHTGNSTVMTPPRIARSQRQQVQTLQRQTTLVGGSGSPHQPSANPQRSASEILKTLLRKKACLYEPDTSLSVALVTWLVGRELAVEYGFFSRQQLQSGVHACVAGKIESGTITRTKVNRCMQIILNSCFHYIIPRSDGTEERGDSFKVAFSGTVKDDASLLRYLPDPWNDLVVKRETVIQASVDEEEEKASIHSVNAFATPKSSPRLSGISLDRSPGKDSTDGNAFELKRAVLLCFNENVRSAEDVFRCHNEFIRDTANASHLQLSAQEWRTFFGREAAGTRFLWGNVGIPMSIVTAPEGLARQSDVLGQLSQGEARKFRTSWCTKRYDHDHDLCGFAHVEVNNGWLRRNPGEHDYKDEMCSFVSTSIDKRVSPNHFVVNECVLGVHCGNAHSIEEIMYHPCRYKVNVCPHMHTRSSGCALGDVCPHLHPPESTRSVKKSAEMRSHGLRHGKKIDQSTSCGGAKGSSTPPIGSPVIYASPAPVSSFEKLLAMPGLQCLFRRHSSIIRADIGTSGRCPFFYSCFGDDWGIGEESVSTSPPCGLPSTATA
jgi:hypothetical protein